MFGEDVEDDSKHSHECIVTDDYVIFQTIDFDVNDYHHDFIKISLSEWKEVKSFIDDELDKI